MRPAVVVRNVSKAFRLKHGFTIRETLAQRKLRKDPTTMVQALDQVSLTVEEGAGVALMGLNGSGKSTLLKLVSGVMQPDTGSIHVRGRVAGLIEIGAGMHQDLSATENIYLNGAILGMTRAETEERFDAIVDFASIERFLDTPVRFLSSGMFSRLGFSIAIHAEPDIFLVDEVLAVGDSQFKNKCRQALVEKRQTQGMTLVIVAHEFDLLRQLCTEAAVLAEGKLIFTGDLEEAEALVEGDDEDPVDSAPVGREPVTVDG